MPSGTVISTKIDSKWIGLQGPHSLIWWIQNELAATASIKTTQIQPMVRWGNVPFGAASWITPSTNAAIAAKAWTGIAGAASKSGARLTRSHPLTLELFAPELFAPLRRRLSERNVVVHVAVAAACACRHG